MTKKELHRARRIRQVERLKKRAVELLGSECYFCGSGEELENAHVDVTKMLRAGAGRGSIARFKDVVDNPDAYKRMCKSCHQKFDRLTSKLVDRLMKQEASDIPF